MEGRGCPLASGSWDCGPGLLSGPVVSRRTPVKWVGPGASFFFFSYYHPLSVNFFGPSGTLWLPTFGGDGW